MSSPLSRSNQKAQHNNGDNGFQFPKWEVLIETGLLKRILLTIALLAFYRFGVQVPLSGIDHQAFMAKGSGFLNSNVLGLVDLFAGGALSSLSIFALGIGPYITSSIMMQLLSEVFPQLKTLQQERGESGRREYQQWIRRLSVFIAIIQSFALTKWLVSSGLVTDLPIMFFLKSVISLTTGCVFVMWIGELISEFGIGNGASLLIFAGIAARLPKMIAQTSEAVKTGITPVWGIITLLAFFLLSILAIIYIQDGIRKLLIVNAKNVTGQVKGPANSNFLPFKINPSGVMPIIFASATLYVPLQILSFFTGRPDLGMSASLQKIFVEGKFFKPLVKPLLDMNWLKNFFTWCGAFFDRLFDYYSFEHSVLYFSLIIIFAFFYSSIQLNPREIAENLQKGGSAVQGVKPGKATAEYINKVLSRIIFIGATCIALITILPIHVEKFCQVTTLGSIGGTSLIIMVGVALDLNNQMIAYLQSHQYKVRSLLGS